jgi:hypothetical protein
MTGTGRDPSGMALEAIRTVLMLIIGGFMLYTLYDAGLMDWFITGFLG